MNSHDPKRIKSAPARQFWRAFSYVMQVHENHYIKRAGVAGVRARAESTCGQNAAQFPGRWRVGIGGPSLGGKKRAPCRMLLRRFIIVSKNKATFSSSYHRDQKPSVMGACSVAAAAVAAVLLPYHFLSLLLLLLVIGSPYLSLTILDGGLEGGGGGGGFCVTTLFDSAMFTLNIFSMLLRFRIIFHHRTSQWRGGRRWWWRFLIITNFTHQILLIFSRGTIR